MREIIILATFRIGTTIDNPKKAEEHCKQLLLGKLKENHIAGAPDSGELFSIEIERVGMECYWTRPTRCTNAR